MGEASSVLSKEARSFGHRNWYYGSVAFSWSRAGRLVGVVVGLVLGGIAYWIGPWASTKIIEIHHG